MQILRSARCFSFVLLMLALAAPSFAGVSVSVTIAPPVLPVYEQPPCPGDGYIWTPGYWAYGPDGYYWVPGTWATPPTVGLYTLASAAALTAFRSRVAPGGHAEGLSKAHFWTASPKFERPINHKGRHGHKGQPRRYGQPKNGLRVLTGGGEPGSRTPRHLPRGCDRGLRPAPGSRSPAA